MAKWMQNFKTAKLGGPALIKELTTSFVLNDGKPTSYGYGIYVDTNRGLRRWRHGGNDIAHSSTFVYYPDIDAGYVVFSNYQGVPGRIASVVEDAFFSKHMTAVEPAPANAGVNVPVATLRRYAGKYEVPTLGGALVTVDLQGDQLRLQRPGQPTLALRPTSTTTFEALGAPARISFTPAGDGAVEAFTLEQDGIHTGKRVVEKTAVDLASYAGRYFSAELETFYDLKVESDQLVIRHRRFGPAALKYAGTDTFAGTLPVTQVVFSRDAKGNVTGFAAGNGRARDISFKRVD